jgi:hypothetical protein
MTEKNKEQIENDYDFSRDHYYKLVEKGDEAIDLMMDLARESEHPRAFEVLATMIKTNAEIADRLMDLQKKNKDIKKEDPTASSQPQLGVTNNNLFVGSTKDLAKMIDERQSVIKANPIKDDDDSNIIDDNE